MRLVLACVLARAAALRPEPVRHASPRALSEGEAYDCMMTAHQAGMAVVGVYQFEVAENYCTQMKESGLVAAVKPVGDGNE